MAGENIDKLPSARDPLNPLSNEEEGKILLSDAVIDRRMLDARLNAIRNTSATKSIGEMSEHEKQMGALLSSQETIYGTLQQRLQASQQLNLVRAGGAVGSDAERQARASIERNILTLKAESYFQISVYDFLETSSRALQTMTRMPSAENVTGKESLDAIHRDLGLEFGNAIKIIQDKRTALGPLLELHYLSHRIIHAIDGTGDTDKKKTECGQIKNELDKLGAVQLSRENGGDTTEYQKTLGAALDAYAGNPSPENKRKLTEATEAFRDAVYRRTTETVSVPCTFTVAPIRFGQDPKDAKVEIIIPPPAGTPQDKLVSLPHALEICLTIRKEALIMSRKREIDSVTTAESARERSYLETARQQTIQDYSIGRNRRLERITRSYVLLATDDQAARYQRMLMSVQVVLRGITQEFERNPAAKSKLQAKAKEWQAAGYPEQGKIHEEFLRDLNALTLRDATKDFGKTITDGMTPAILQKMGLAEGRGTLSAAADQWIVRAVVYLQQRDGELQGLTTAVKEWKDETDTKRKSEKLTAITAILKRIPVDQVFSGDQVQFLAYQLNLLERPEVRNFSADTEKKLLDEQRSHARRLRTYASQWRGDITGSNWEQKAEHALHVTIMSSDTRAMLERMQQEAGGPMWPIDKIFAFHRRASFSGVVLGTDLDQVARGKESYYGFMFEPGTEFGGVTMLPHLRDQLEGKLKDKDGNVISVNEFMEQVASGAIDAKQATQMIKGVLDETKATEVIKSVIETKKFFRDRIVSAADDVEWSIGTLDEINARRGKTILDRKELRETHLNLVPLPKWPQEDQDRTNVLFTLRRALSNDPLSHIEASAARFKCHPSEVLAKLPKPKWVSDAEAEVQKTTEGKKLTASQLRSARYVTLAKYADKEAQSRLETESKDDFLWLYSHMLQEPSPPRPDMLSQMEGVTIQIRAKEKEMETADAKTRQRLQTDIDTLKSQLVWADNLVRLNVVLSNDALSFATQDYLLQLNKNPGLRSDFANLHYSIAKKRANDLLLAALGLTEVAAGVPAAWWLGGRGAAARVTGGRIPMWWRSPSLPYAVQAAQVQGSMPFTTVARIVNGPFSAVDRVLTAGVRAGRGDVGDALRALWDPTWRGSASQMRDALAGIKAPTGTAAGSQQALAPIFDQLGQLEQQVANLGNTAEARKMMKMIIDHRIKLLGDLGLNVKGTLSADAWGKVTAELQKMLAAKDLAPEARATIEKLLGRAAPPKLGELLADVHKIGCVDRASLRAGLLNVLRKAGIGTETDAATRTLLVDTGAVGLRAGSTARLPGGATDTVKTAQSAESARLTPGVTRLAEQVSGVRLELAGKMKRLDEAIALLEQGNANGGKILQGLGVSTEGKAASVLAREATALRTTCVSATQELAAAEELLAAGNVTEAQKALLAFSKGKDATLLAKTLKFTGTALVIAAPFIEGALAYGAVLETQRLNGVRQELVKQVNSMFPSALYDRDGDVFTHKESGYSVDVGGILHISNELLSHAMWEKNVAIGSTVGTAAASVCALCISGPVGMGAAAGIMLIKWIIDTKSEQDKERKLRTFMSTVDPRLLQTFPLELITGYDLKTLNNMIGPEPTRSDGEDVVRSRENLAVRLAIQRLKKISPLPLEQLSLPDGTILAQILAETPFKEYAMRNIVPMDRLKAEAWNILQERGGDALLRVVMAHVYEMWNAHVRQLESTEFDVFRPGPALKKAREHRAMLGSQYYGDGRTVAEHVDALSKEYGRVMMDPVKERSNVEGSLLQLRPEPFRTREDVERIGSPKELKLDYDPMIRPNPNAAVSEAVGKSLLLNSPYGVEQVEHRGLQCYRIATGGKDAYAYFAFISGQWMWSSDDWPKWRRVGTSMFQKASEKFENCNELSRALEGVERGMIASRLGADNAMDKPYVRAIGASALASIGCVAETLKDGTVVYTRSYSTATESTTRFNGDGSVTKREEPSRDCDSFACFEGRWFYRGGDTKSWRPIESLQSTRALMAISTKEDRIKFLESAVQKLTGIRNADVDVSQIRSRVTRGTDLLITQNVAPVTFEADRLGVCCYSIPVNGNKAYFAFIGGRWHWSSTDSPQWVSVAVGRYKESSSAGNDHAKANAIAEKLADIEKT